MFVGWFKINGHSNPKSRKGFERSNSLLKNKQRLGKGIILSGKKEFTRSFYRQKNSLLTKIFFTALISIGIIGFSLIISSLTRNEISVINQMETRQLVITGSNEFISPTEKLRRTAEEQFRNKNYIEAYFIYKEAYKLGATDNKVYLGLLESTKKLCEEKNEYCEEIEEWKKVIDRIK